MFYLQEWIGHVIVHHLSTAFWTSSNGWNSTNKKRNVQFTARTNFSRTTFLHIDRECYYMGVRVATSLFAPPLALSIAAQKGRKGGLDTGIFAAAAGSLIHSRNLLLPAQPVTEYIQACGAWANGLGGFPSYVPPPHDFWRALVVLQPQGISKEQRRVWGTPAIGECVIKSNSKLRDGKRVIENHASPFGGVCCL
jgi:hypothetical protein